MSDRLPQDDDDVVTLEQIPNTTNIQPKSQVEDYIQRGEGLATYNLLSFVVDTYEDAKRSRAAPEDHSGTRAGAAGRPRSVRVPYNDSHPRSGTTTRVVRTKTHNTLPNVVGPFFPRRDDASKREQYCASMLALLKPWRSSADLKGLHESWDDAFEEWRTAEATERDKRILSNIQYYHESQRAAEEERERDGDELDDVSGQRTGVEPVEDLLDAATEDVTPDIEVTEKDLESYLQSLRPARDETNADDAMLAAYDRQIFLLRARWNATSRAQRLEGDDHVRLDQWLTEMRSDPEAQRITNNGEELDNGNVTRGDDNSDTSDDDDDTSDDEMAADLGDINQVPTTVNEGSCDPSILNDEQRRAYDIMTRHMEQTKDRRDVEQLLMVVHGEGGTGKSKVIELVTKRFELCDVPTWLKKGAFTGIAAALIGGNTLHTLAQISLQGRNPSARARRMLALFWATVRYLIIDEISMVSAEFFDKLTRILADARGGSANAPFGGLNVILLGDFHQFPPVAGTPLYWTNSETREGDERRTGRALYEQFTTVVLLKQQMRTQDGVWSAFLRRLRQGGCSRDDHTLVESLK